MGGPAEGLFQEEFYRNLKEALRPGGIAVTQSGSPFYQPRALEMAYRGGMRSVFRNVRVYTAFIPTYPSGFWSFTMGSDAEFSSPKGVRVGRYFNGDIMRGLLPSPAVRA